MNQSNEESIVVLLAGYSEVTGALDAYDAVRGVFEERNADDAAYCDAAVINPHQTDLSSRVLRETPPARERQAEHAQAHEGLARRLARYLGEGLALTGGPAGGGGQDIPFTTTTGEASGPLEPDDLKELGAVQESSSVVLIGIFPAMMRDRIEAATNAADRRASKELRASVGQLEAQIARAEQKAIADTGR